MNGRELRLQNPLPRYHEWCDISRNGSDPQQAEEPESRGVVITMKWCARAEGFAVCQLKAFEQFTEEDDLFALGRCTRHSMMNLRRVSAFWNSRISCLCPRVATDVEERCDEREDCIKCTISKKRT